MRFHAFWDATRFACEISYFLESLNDQLDVKWTHDLVVRGFMFFGSYEFSWCYEIPWWDFMKFQYELLLIHFDPNEISLWDFMLLATFFSYEFFSWDFMVFSCIIILLVFMLLGWKAFL